MLLMLLLVCAGLFGMHTLGHQPKHLAAHVHADASPTAADPMAQPDRMAIGCCVAGNGAALTGHTPAAPMHDPNALCLAILCAAAVTVLLLLVWRGRPVRGGHLFAGYLPAGRAARAPPPRPRIGLLLADLAVLRN